MIDIMRVGREKSATRWALASLRPLPYHLAAGGGAGAPEGLIPRDRGSIPRRPTALLLR